MFSCLNGEISGVMGSIRRTFLYYLSLCGVCVVGIRNQQPPYIASCACESCQKRSGRLTKGASSSRRGAHLETKVCRCACTFDKLTFSGQHPGTPSSANLGYTGTLVQSPYASGATWRTFGQGAFWISVGTRTIQLCVGNNPRYEETVVAYETRAVWMRLPGSTVPEAHNRCMPNYTAAVCTLVGD